jgi:hypothetical protein
MSSRSDMEYLGSRRVLTCSYAAAYPSRRRLFDSLNERSGQTLRELCAGLDIARQSVS